MSNYKDRQFNNTQRAEQYRTIKSQVLNQKSRVTSVLGWCKLVREIEEVASLKIKGFIFDREVLFAGIYLLLNWHYSVAN